MREHLDDESCWCEPYVEWVSSAGDKVWVHRDLEHGTVPPPEIIAQAIIECLMDDEEIEDGSKTPRI